MKRVFLVGAALLGAAFLQPQKAEAGCLSGAVVGGLVGHAVGHGGIGAAAGCAYGAHRANDQKRARYQERGQRDGRAPRYEDEDR